MPSWNSTGAYRRTLSNGGTGCDTKQRVNTLIANFFVINELLNRGLSLDTQINLLHNAALHRHADNKWGSSNPSGWRDTNV